jgi:ketosteroid isomerase-like protein
MVRGFIIAGLLLAGGLSAQTKNTQTKSTKGEAKKEQYDFHPLMQQVWDAWSTLNPDNAARFYSKNAELTFFDLAPLQYTGWSEYSAGVKKVFADYSSAKFTLSGSQHVFQRPMVAWASSTGHGIMTKRSGNKDEFDFRWTVVWQKQGDDWLIIHEHVSVPMGGGPAASKPATPASSGPKAATAPKK